MNIICSDLEAQYLELDDLVSGLSLLKWFIETPFYQWKIFDEVAHIAFFDREALLALEDEKRFKKNAEKIMKIVLGNSSWPSLINPLLGIERPDELLTNWRKTRADLLKALSRKDPQERIPWYGPDMSARSFASARLMETWAHSQDIFDTLGIKRKNRPGIKHIAHIGIKTFKWSFIIRGLERPDFTPRAELIGPDGHIWEWGDTGAPERICGMAEEFCLVVTQRRNVKDTGLQCHGKTVEKWLCIAQAFAGTVQEHPEPGTRVCKIRERK